MHIVIVPQTMKQVAGEGLHVGSGYQIRYCTQLFAHFYDQCK